jgi:hypothetical protein
MAHGEEGGGDDPQEEEEAEACLGGRKAATAWGEGAGGARWASAGDGRRQRRERGVETMREQGACRDSLKGFCAKLPPHHLIRDGGSICFKL